MKIFKTKMILAVVTALVLISTLPFFQSCSEDNIEKAQQIEYLDLDVSNVKALTTEQRQILKEAKSRIEPFVVLEGKTYRLTINSASKINISKRLFDYYKATIENTNLMIKDLNVVVDKNDPKKLKIILPANLKSNKRQKVLGYESTPVDGENSWNVDWDGVHLYLNNETTKKLTLALIGGAALSEITAIIATATGVGAPAGVVAGIAGVVFGAGAGVVGTMNDGKGVELTYGLFGWDVESR